MVNDFDPLIAALQKREDDRCRRNRVVMLYLTLLAVFAVIVWITI